MKISKTELLKKFGNFEVIEAIYILRDNNKIFSLALFPPAPKKQGDSTPTKTKAPFVEKVKKNFCF